MVARIAGSLAIVLTLLSGSLIGSPPSPAGSQTAETTWAPLAQQPAQKQIALECLPQGSVQDDGRYVVQAGDTFTGGSNRYGPWLLVQGDFGVQVSLEAATEDKAAITLFGVPQQPQGPYWQGIKRLDLGLQSGQVSVLIYTGESQTPFYTHLFPVGDLPRPAALGVRRLGSDLVFYAGGSEIGRTADPGLFASGEVYLGTTVAPHNQMVIDDISVEVPSGNPASIRVMPDLDAAARNDSSLRAAAAPRQFQIGAQGVPGDGAFTGSPEDRATLAREFNSVTIYTSFSGQHPAPDRWDLCDLDVGVAYAQANQMTISAQTLLYDGIPGALPDWLINVGFSADQVRSAVHDYITKVVGRYRGRIARWNVENELLDDKGQMRDLFLGRTLGAGFLDLVFQWAHDADPAAKLFYNDYRAEGMGPKSDGVFSLVKGLRDRGVPIDGVGLQMHLTVDPTRKPFENAPPPTADVAANMQRLAGLGLDAYITEMDVKVGQDATAATLDAQAQVFAGMLRVCLAAPNCGAFTTWGVSDRYSWYRRPCSTYNFPGLTPGLTCGVPWEQPLLFDENFKPKPAYAAVLQVLAGH